MYPLIPRFTEVGVNGTGTINHAIRVNVGKNKIRCTDRDDACPQLTPGTPVGFPQGYLWPASHSDGAAKTTTPAALPMGAHLRLKANYNWSCSPNCPQATVFVKALQQYGVIIADSDGAGYGDMGLHAEWTPDGGWNESDIQQLNNIPISAFEVVNANDGGCADFYSWCPACAHPCGP